MLVEGNYIAKWNLNETELNQIYRLRYQVYAVENGWVEKQNDECDTDNYDAHSIHFAVFHQNECVATIRITPSHHPWMLESCFIDTVDGCPQQYKEVNAFEASRLAIKSCSRQKKVFQQATVLDLLLKSVIQFSLSHNVHKLYLVTLPVVIKCLNRKGLTSLPIAKPYQYPDGVNAQAACFDMKRYLLAKEYENNDSFKHINDWAHKNNNTKRIFSLKQSLRQWYLTKYNDRVAA